MLDAVDEAVLQGWSEPEALAAIVAISENRMLAISENSDVENLLAILRDRS